MTVDGLLPDDQDQIEKALINLYKFYMIKNFLREAWFGIWKGKVISAQNASWLEKDFTLEEIKEATFELTKDKALGPEIFP